MGTKLQRGEIFQAVFYAIVLLWINVYVCRELFWAQTAYMNSMHGFWIALARWGGGWFHATWWPYWDCGIPFEFTYAPLIPGLIGAWAALRGVPYAAALQAITGAVYCLAPLTLFAAAWLLTRAPGYSFLAALIYSLTSPSQLLLPDGTFPLDRLRDARRLILLAVWDDLPHLVAVALLPLAILFLTLAIRKRGLIYCGAAALLIAAMALASPFGPVIAGMAALCLLFVFRREVYRRNFAIVLGIGAFAYAIAAPFLSPSLIEAIRAASTNKGEEGWTLGSVTALAMVWVGWVILWRYLRKWSGEWTTQFFILFAYLVSSVPILAVYFHRQFLPQPERYKLEMALALPPAVVFGVRRLLEKAPRTLKAALLFLLLALAGEQIVNYRHLAKEILRPGDVTQTVEYRASMWADENLHGVRLMLPGSIGQWANAFARVPQFSGGSWSMAYNPVEQRGLAAIYNGGETAAEDARVSLLWLKAFGVGAVLVNGPASQEYWKAFAHPNKFDGVLPVLWRANDAAIYRVPQRTESLAHVVPETALMSRSPSRAGDTAGLERYVEALDDPSLPPAAFQWDGTNRIRIQSELHRGQVVSVQVSYHAGWRATAGGRTIPVGKDGLGLMWLRPQCAGLCEIQLDYDGGWELRLLRCLSFAAITVMLLLALRAAFRYWRAGRFVLNRK
ncbi:MAG: hypothetical protein ABI165_07110 [Bryobacteraceae bacterium]